MSCYISILETLKSLPAFRSAALGKVILLLSGVGFFVALATAFSLLYFQIEGIDHERKPKRQAPK